MSNLTASQKDTLANFASRANKLEKIVAGLSEQELEYSIAPGEWTIRQIVHHLAGDGDAWSKPFWRAITTPGATITRDGFAGTGIWVDTINSNNCPVQISLTLIKAHRRLIAELAERFPDSWEQDVTILNPEGKGQKIPAAQIINMLSEHMAEHLSTIEAIQKRHNV